MRRSLVSIALCLGACATTQPLDVRPVERTSDSAPSGSVASVPVPPRLYNGTETCEALRLVATPQVEQSLVDFAECLLETGEAVRAFHVVEGTDTDTERRAAVLSGRAEADEVELNALLADREDARLWNLLGRLYEAQGRDAEAVDAFVRAKQLQANR